MAVTPTTFKARFPEFTSIDDTRIQVFLDETAAILSESYWGELYDMGTNFYTAHVLYLDEQNSAGNAAGTSGPIVSRSVEGVSIAYGQANLDNAGTGAAWLSSTRYGQRYLQLRKSLGAVGFVV